MKRTPLVRRTRLAAGAATMRRKPMTPRVQQAAAPRPEGNPIPPAVRAAIRERSGGRCEIRGAVGCTGIATEQHHRKRRREGGHGLANLLDACDPCHDHAHAHPRLARERGWIVSAFAVDPALEPVRYGDPVERLVWLHDDGTKDSTDISTLATRRHT